MAFILTLQGKEHRAEVEERSPGQYRVVIDGESHDVDARRTNANVYSFLVDHQVFEADIESGNNGELQLMLRGRVLDVHAIDERRKMLRAAAGQGAAAGGVLKTPMPGKVVRVLAAPGTPVKRGQGVIVVEAMKMENELGAPADGVVKEIKVEEGQAVDGNAVLAVIE